jgi:hypothetical protein
MKSSLLIAALLLFFSFSVPAQKTNAQLSSQIRNGKIKLSFEGGSTKLMGVGENFTDSEAKAAKVMAMNFAIGFFYPGQTLERAPEQIMLTFWIMSKKPAFAEKHSLTFYVGGDEIIVGDARYGAKARENMEYLNFNISRDVLVKVASNSNVQFKLGDTIFAFSRNHMRMIADLLVLSDPMGN